MPHETRDVLHLDYETFSEADLTKVGAHKYAMHPSTEILCAAWAFNDEEPQLWAPGQPVPDRVVDHILDDGIIEAWNAQFERLITRFVAGPKYGWPIPSTKQYECVMVRALAMSFPGKLEHAAKALQLDMLKDEHGHRIMMKLCKPRRPTKKDKRTRWTYEMVPLQFDHLYRYCLQDVRTEQAASKRLTRLKPSEQEFYWRDQEINDRGITIDLDLVRAMQEVVDQEKEVLDEQMRAVTGGEVASTNAAKQLVVWLAQGGIVWPANQNPSVDKDNVIRLLGRDDLTEAQRKAIMIRQEAAKTSTAKLEKFEGMVCRDGTIKGTLQFHGASTGRDAARGVQVQNFPRPRKKTPILKVIESLFNGADAELIDLLYGSPMSVIADLLRSCIRARPGHILYTRDASQIEARMTAWLAGETAVLRAFAAYDRKEGPDIYRVAAAQIYGKKPEQITDEERQVGKVAVLALGFGGGAGAFASMAKIYGVDLATIFQSVWDMSEPEFQEKALEAWKQRGRSTGMRKAAWLTAELIKLAWRATNPNIVQFWKDLEDAAISALLHPGETFRVGKLKFRKTGSFLRMVLPSGRSLFFAYPSLVRTTTPWGKQVFKIEFYAVDGQTKRFLQWSLWGGLICQNAVQAAARDVLFEAVVRLEEAGYPNVLRIHDECVHETPEGFGSEEEFHQLFVQTPAWAPDLPLAADGWIGPRYRK